MQSEATTTAGATAGTTEDLAAFVAALRYRDVPGEVVERTKDLFLDWAASALAGRESRPVAALEGFMQTMGPSEGPSEVLTNRGRTSPLFGAMVNAASSHVVEQDDVHNGSVFHPGAVVFPAALAVAQQTGATGRDFIAASVAGYEVGVRVGEFLGRSHYRVFHTTGTVGTLASAAAVSCLLGLDEERTLHALGSAGTQAAGLWEFLRDAADSKQLHTAKAASDGLLAAYLARDGLTGARRILEGKQGMAAGMSSDEDPSRLTDGLGERWAVLETSFKFHASCRHTHPAADALLVGMEEHGLAAGDVASVRARVHQGAIDVLGPVTDPQTIHQSKFSMGFVLALIADRGRASITDFTEEALRDQGLRNFHDRVEMVPDREVDGAYPRAWIGLVDIETKDGRTITSRVDVPKGDPENTLSREEIEEKTRSLAAFGGGTTAGEVERIIARTWNLEDEHDLRDILPAKK
ncbi:MAG: MmgE/PrpD family protein [Rubrobacteraceae bacterium]